MFTVESVKNLKWCDEEKTMFECNVKYAEFEFVHPSGINGTDQTAHIREIWERANAGEFGPIADYVPLATAEDQPVVQGAQTL